MPALIEIGCSDVIEMCVRKSYVFSDTEMHEAARACPRRERHRRNGQLEHRDVDRTFRSTHAQL
jgi:hypothetical protein